MTPIVVFDLDNTLVHSRIDFLGIRMAIISRLLDVGALSEPPPDPRARVYGPGPLRRSAGGHC